jgi:hypothetical protein
MLLQGQSAMPDPIGTIPVRSQPKEPTMPNIIYDNHGVTVDAALITPANTETLLGRAVSHILSNEVPKEIRADEAAALAWRLAKIENLYSGELGVRKSGEPKPSTDPVLVIARELSEKAVRKIVADKGWKVARGPKDAYGKPVGLVIAQADGTVIKTLAQAIIDRLANEKFGLKHLDDAKAEHARRTKAAEKATATLEGDDEI